MRTTRSRLIGWLMLLGACGTAARLGGCSISFNDATAFIRDFNPCGTILACDPDDYGFLTSGYRGPGVDPDIDPFCTYPPLCPPASDPIAGGLSPGNP